MYKQSFWLIIAISMVAVAAYSVYDEDDFDKDEGDDGNDLEEGGARKGKICMFLF